MGVTGRATARALVRSTELVPLPSVPDELEPNSAEAMAFLSDYEASRLASLGQTMGRMMERVLNTSSSELELTSNGSNDEREPWQELGADILASLKSHRRAAQSTPQYHRSAQFNTLYGTYDGERTITVAQQLDAGAKSAVATSLTFLRNLSRIVWHHESAILESDFAYIARDSLALPQPMALLCLNGLTAARDSLAQGTLLHHRSWDAIDTVLDVTKYKLVDGRDGSKHIRHKDFPGLEAPKGYQLASGMKPLDDTISIRDLSCHLGERFGCPITYLDRSLKQFWDWQIGLVDSRQMWTLPFPETSQAESL